MSHTAISNPGTLFTVKVVQPSCFLPSLLRTRRGIFFVFWPNKLSGARLGSARMTALGQSLRIH